MKEDWPDENVEHLMLRDLDLNNIWDQIEQRRNDKNRKRRFLWFFMPAFFGGMILLAWIVTNDDGITDEDVFIEVQEILVDGIEDISFPIENKNRDNTMNIDEGKNQNHFDVLIDKVTLKSKDNSISDYSSEIQEGLEVDEKIRNHSELSKRIFPQAHDFLIYNDNITLNEESILLGVESEPTIDLEGNGIGKVDFPKLKGLTFFVEGPVRKMRREILPIIKTPFKKELFAGSRFFIGYASRDFKLNNLKTNADIDYFNLRSETESVVESYGTELYLKGTLTSSIFYEFGLSISNVTLKTDYRYQIQSTQMTQSDSAIVIEYLDGGISYFNGISTQYSTETYQSFHYSHLLTVGVPVRIGYSRSLNNNLDIGFSTGIIYNFYSRGKGYVVADQRQSEIFIDLSNQGYNNMQILQSTSQLTINCRLNYHWMLEAGLQYLCDFNSRLSLNSYSDKYKSVNAQLGVVLRL